MPAAKKETKVVKVPKKVEKKEKKSNIYPVDTKVDEKTRFKGKVVYFSKQSGFGFIKPEKDNIVPDDKVMVFWKEISSDDKWPFLHKDLAVEFNLVKFTKTNGSGCIIKAKEVTLAGKKKINLQEASEEKLDFVHSMGTRFTGEVKFFNVAKGFGIVTLEDGYAGVESVPKELRVVRAQINSGSEAPCLRSGLKVEFGIAKNKADKYFCFNLSMPGGSAIARNVVEERKNEGNATFTGTLSFVSLNGFGYIKPDSEAKLPAKVKASLADAKERASKRLNKAGKDKKADKIESLIYFRRGDVTSDAKSGKRGAAVSFKLYLDNRGVGAREVSIKA